MNDKEIGEIRRHLRRDRSNITALYGCYVNENHTAGGDIFLAFSPGVRYNKNKRL